MKALHYFVLERTWLSNLGTFFFHYSDFLLENYYKRQDHHYNSKAFSLSFNGSNFWFRVCAVHDSEFQSRKLGFYICILVKE